MSVVLESLFSFVVFSFFFLFGKLGGLGGTKFSVNTISGSFIQIDSWKKSRHLYTGHCLHCRFLKQQSQKVVLFSRFCLLLVVCFWSNTFLARGGGCMGGGVIRRVDANADKRKMYYHLGKICTRVWTQGTVHSNSGSGSASYFETGLKKKEPAPKMSLEQV